MPEGHTIHRIARDHQKWFAGQSLIVESPQGRFASEAKKLFGKKMIRTDAHGKHLFYFWAGGQIVHIHLGLYGKFRIHKNPPPEPRGAVRLRMVGDSKSFDLNGPNCCELIDKFEHEKLCNRLGQDPLRTDANPQLVWERIRKSHASIGSLLLNQSLIAGVGNVYRSEILFLLKINPERLGVEIIKSEFDAIWRLTVELLNIGVQLNRIVTTTVKGNELNQSSKNHSEKLNVYKKNQCPVCRDDIYYWTSANRTIYACESCQK